MNIQGIIPNKEEQVVHYSEDRLNSTSDYPVISTSLLPTVVEEGEEETENRVRPVEESTSEGSKQHLNPALLLSSNSRFDKRKSSPAILGLPFGIKHESQLSLHLSQQRNSIEAAMLLANFNKLMAFPKPTELEHNKGQWQDDMSIPTKNQNSWGDLIDNETESNRRYSYDVNMSWQTMPETFLDRPDLLHNMTSTNNTEVTNSPEIKDVPLFKQENLYNNNNTITWSHDDLQSHHIHPHQSNNNNNNNSTNYIEYSNHPISPRQYNKMYHPTMSSPLAPHNYNQPIRFPPPLPHPQEGPMLHPLSRQPDKRELIDQPYYSYTFPPPLPHPPTNSIQQRYYYPNHGKLPLPSHSIDPQLQQSQQQSQQQPQPQQPQQVQPTHHHHPPPILAKPKRKKQKSTTNSVEFEEDIGVEPNEEDYPDMSTRDIEAARTDPEARPRKQKLRFIGDKYTPNWVRYNGQSKEGLCDTCKPGKWLQLKNSAYWYHKQFYHGISSVSGKEFVQPIETRWVDQDLVEGLCHQCHCWVAVSNVKRKNSVLWYRHAHKCHVYHKPKPNVPKKR